MQRGRPDRSARTGTPAGQAPDPGSRTTRIIERVRSIPAGFVVTYGDVDPAAPRLVGRILATTHERLPWHRVIRADGSIPMGARQRDLLLREGVPMRGDRVDLRRARFAGDDHHA
jgi:methylated-DNA-protein-cysteine methyltransferase related protein